MFPGTGPQAVAEQLAEDWQAARAGRPDIPKAVTDPDSEFGVRILHDRESVDQQRAVHDMVHCYHPQADPVNVEDNGFKEQRVAENVQVDVVASDRTDPDTGERLSARTRMVGTREDQLDGYGFTLGGPDGATLGGADGGTLGTADATAYPGLLGETVYILETVRRGFAEFDKVSYTLIGSMLKNSSARMSLDVQLEQIARNTVV